MLKMFLEKLFPIGWDERGVGLITAIFVIVIVGMFGALIARYMVISSVSSAEDYHWAQALYSAQSAAQIAILFNDGGGTGGENLSMVADFSTSATTVDCIIRAVAQKNIDGEPIHREIEVRTAL